jgi:peptide deformylase
MEHPECLKLLPYESLLLRSRSSDVAFPLSLEDKKLVRDMRFSIQPEQLTRRAAGMAAVQWGHAKRVFLWEVDSLFQVCFNPSYEPVGSEVVDAEEGCFSIPGARRLVRRWVRIRFRFADENGVETSGELRDWPARVWQHETDHTLGFLYDDEKAGKCLKKVLL